MENINYKIRLALKVNDELYLQKIVSTSNWQSMVPADVIDALEHYKILHFRKLSLREQFHCYQKRISIKISVEEFSSLKQNLLPHEKEIIKKNIVRNNMKSFAFDLVKRFDNDQRIRLSIVNKLLLVFWKFSILPFDNWQILMDYSKHVQNGRIINQLGDIKSDLDSIRIWEKYDIDIDQEIIRRYGILTRVICGRKINLSSKITAHKEKILAPLIKDTDLVVPRKVVS